MVDKVNAFKHIDTILDKNAEVGVIRDCLDTTCQKLLNTKHKAYLMNELKRKQMSFKSKKSAIDTIFKDQNNGIEYGKS